MKYVWEGEEDLLMWIWLKGMTGEEQYHIEEPEHSMLM